jgi:hypothetical protein
MECDSYWHVQKSTVCPYHKPVEFRKRIMLYSFEIHYNIILKLDNSHVISFYELLTTKINLKSNIWSDVISYIILIWECFKGRRTHSWCLFILLSFLRKGMLIAVYVRKYPVCIWNTYSDFPWNVTWSSRHQWLLKLYTSLIPHC